MNNHVHLLVETQEIPLSKILQGINQSYTMYFNKRYKTVGHLFQGRYKAILCDKDAYLLSLIKYIHLNPVRAKITKIPEEYKWSSHFNYLERVKDSIVDTDQVLRMFSENKAQARKLYGAYIADGISIKKEDIYRTVDQRILGDEGFVDKVTEKTEESFECKKKRHEYSLEEIAKKVEQIFGITLRQLREKSKDRGITTGRKLMSFAAKEYGYKGKEIAEYLCKDPVVVSRYIRERNNFSGEVEKICSSLRKDKC